MRDEKLRMKTHGVLDVWNEGIGLVVKVYGILQRLSMRCKMIRVFFIFAIVFLVMDLPLNQAFGVNREELGREEKLRVLVDKVLMKSNGWVMTEDHVRQIAEAGFNVVSPRLGGDSMKQVRRVAKYAQKHGIYYMPWMRGTLKARKGPKLVWSNGLEHPIYSPNSDELWDWMSRLIIKYARISLKTPSLIGVFLDFENYSFEKEPSKRLGHAYPLSYDARILKDFAKEKNVVLPRLKPAERFAWLQKKGLHQAFVDFQIEGWQVRAHKLRQAVDFINPQFQFCIYPSGGTPFIQEAIFQEWSTDKAPLILASSITYGRPSKSMPHKRALKVNRNLLTKNIESVQEKITQFLFMGGIDPVVNFADPEFSSRNAVMISQISNGYWVFYEGPQIGKDHELYWKWFSQANHAIEEGKFGFWQEDRQTPDPVFEME